MERIVGSSSTRSTEQACRGIDESVSGVTAVPRPVTISVKVGFKPAVPPCRPRPGSQRRGAGGSCQTNLAYVERNGILFVGNGVKLDCPLRLDFGNGSIFRGGLSEFCWHAIRCADFGRRGTHFFVARKRLILTKMRAWCL